MKRAAIGFLAGVCLVSGVSILQARQARQSDTAARAARVRAMPPAADLLAAARRAQVCVDTVSPGVFSLHARGSAPASFVVRKAGSSVQVSAVAAPGGVTDEDRVRLADEYQASGQSPALYESLLGALDLGIIDEAALRC